MKCKHTGCVSEAWEGAEYCHRHGGHAHAANNDRRRGMMFKIEGFKERAEEFLNDERGKNIQDEIALARAMLEKFVNTIHSGGMAEFVASFPGVRDTIAMIARLVETCHKIQLSQEKHLSAEELTTLIVKISQIITRHVADKEVVAAITADIMRELEDETEEEGIQSAR